VRGIDFSDTGEYFVTCGDSGHLMFWHTQQCYPAHTGISNDNTVSVMYISQSIHAFLLYTRDELYEAVQHNNVHCHVF
jgi:WD40 repeat protein